MTEAKKPDVSSKNVVGCVRGGMQLFIITPMWLILMYRILTVIQADALTWGLYWAYVPACLIGAGISMLHEAFT